MAYLEFNPKDYLHEISNRDLIKELESRHNQIEELKSLKYDFKNDTEKINYLKEIFGLWEIHTKERLLEEIKNFLQI